MSGVRGQNGENGCRPQESNRSGAWQCRNLLCTIRTFPELRSNENFGTQLELIFLKIMGKKYFGAVKISS